MNNMTFKIWRGQGKEGAFEEHATEITEGMVVLDAVLNIQAKEANDPRATRWNCKAGEVRLLLRRDQRQASLYMCMTRCSDIDLNQPVTVEPMKTFPHVKDLVTDVSWNYEAKKRVKPFKPRPPDNPDGTWIVMQEDIDRGQEFRKCIECFLCQNVCHVLREHEKFDGFVGPRMMIHAAYLEMHPLDIENRTGELKDSNGIGYCNITKCCTVVCPKSIKITDNAIIPLKERVADFYYDPLKKLLRLLKR